MEGRLHYINQINDQLSWLATRVASGNQDNRQDMNIVAETVLCGLLNRMYGWNLVNANERNQNFPGVDLVDEDECIAVQVTSTNTVAKVRHTLDEFTAHELGKWFDRLIVLTLTFEDPTKGMKKLERPPFFRGDGDIWNLQYLLRELEKQDVVRQREIAEYLADELGLTAAPEKPQYLLPGVPTPTPSFVEGSRDGELEFLEQALARGPVFLWGLGGIGKTETAIQLAKRCGPPKGAYFLHYYHDAPDGVEALRETILRANFAGYRFEGRDNENRDAEYKERMDILRTEFAGAMVIIDNFDRPGRTLADLRGEPAYRELTAMDIRLVFTTRNEVPLGGVEIRPLTEEDLLTLMRKSCTSRAVSDDDLLELIRAVEGHPLMADLMAKTLAESWGGVTARGMLDALKNSELDQADFPEVVADRNREERQRKLYAHLKALFDLSGMSGEDQSILRCATLLPEDGMQDRLFMECLPKEQRQPLRNLTKRGWLRHEGENLTIHPVIREVCREELKPSDVNCGYFLNKLWKRFDGRTFFDARLYRQMAQCYAVAVEQLEDRKGVWIRRAGWYWRKIGRPQTALIYDMRVVERQEKRKRRNYFYLAVAYQNMGIDYSQLADYPRALECQRKALHIRENRIPLEPLAIARAHCNMSYCYNDLGEYKKALEEAHTALEICQSVTPIDELSLAGYYNSVGYTYCEMGEYSRALEYQGKALEIRERLLRPEHPVIATSYNNVGYDHSMLGNYETALKYQQKALAIRQKELLPDNYSIAISYNNIGYTLMAMGEYGQSLECFQKAAEICQKTLPMDHRYLASSFHGIGAVFGETGEYGRAMVYLERALAIRKKRFPPGHRYVLDTQNMIEWVRKERMKGCP